MAAGPDPLTRKERDDTRYGLTDLLDDLADVQDRHEQLVLADRVLRSASILLTDHHPAWWGNGKWLPRRLTAADPVLGAALLQAHLTLAEHADPAPLTAMAQEILDLMGGPLREGCSSLWAERGKNGE
ncbi:hypothetical protein ACFYZE_10455 [Streptomyces sp. NPDC001796]|uniref:hypothetical protein n=1 Tax=Streptomyces sp. NPDC001796 TaxID=3364609 RepID=UPI0036D0B0C2